MRKRVLFLCALMAFIVLLTSPFACARSNAQDSNAVSYKGQVMVLDNDATAFLQKDESSEQKASFKAGDSVFVTGQDEDWFEIFYKGDVLYIKRNAISAETYASNEASNIRMAQAAEEELKSKEKTDTVVIESYEVEEKRNISSIVWKGAIIVLVVLIIILSVVIGISNSKMDKN